MVAAVELRDVNLSVRQGLTLRKRNNFVPLLKNISLSIEEGAVLGVAGRNGAGKSTLLKLIAGVFKPSRGTIKYAAGYVPILMSVHAGFMGHLSGYENTKLVGLMYGLSLAEVSELSLIVQKTSGINMQQYEKPVATYSSGMQARLSFAIATSLESKLLLVDETLSVGDASFRHEATQKMKRMIKSDKTVVLVSHNLATLKSLSDEIVIIENGELYYKGEPSEAVEIYKELCERNRV